MISVLVSNASYATVYEVVKPFGIAKILRLSEFKLFLVLDLYTMLFFFFYFLRKVFYQFFFSFQIYVSNLIQIYNHATFRKIAM